MRFFLLDKVTEWKLGASAAGIKNISLSEDFFNDHFPKYPVMPGVLILEALAQLSGLLLEATVEKEYGRKVKALISMIEKVKFRQVVKPGDTLLLTTKIVSLHEDAGKVHVKANAGDKAAAECEMVFVWIVLDDPELEKQRQRLLDFWMRDIPDALK